MESIQHPTRGPIPKSGPERYRLEQAIKKGDRIAEVNQRADTAITTIRTRASIDKDTKTIEPHYENLYNDTYAMIHSAAETLEARTYSGNWLDYFRTKHLAGAFDSITKAPLAFKERDSQPLKDVRLDLANGLYGVSGELLQEAYELFMSGGRRNFGQLDYAELRGVINELTAIALLNRDQSSTRMATPSLLNDDFDNATDIEYWAFDRTGNGYSIPIQVKTAPPHDFTVPESGFFILAEHMQNSQQAPTPFLATSLIIKELSGGGSDLESKELSTIHADFMRYINRGVELLTLDTEEASRRTFGAAVIDIVTGKNITPSLRS